MREIRTGCCVVGGGPAGMMLGFLLARAGVEVVVLENHADFLRDFRGDTVHPSTLELMYELGILDDFLKRPHQQLQRIAAQIGESRVWVADFTHLPTHAKFIAFVPQWDFLNFLAERAQSYPEFRLDMQAEVAGVIEENGVIRGVRASTPAGELIVRSALVVGADGRHSILRDQAGLIVEDKGAPIDVFWMRISRRQDDPEQSLGRMDRGRILVMLNRGEYWQCAFVFPKGAAERIQALGIAAFQEQIASLAPALHDRVGELATWDDVKLLTVKVDRLRNWYRPGLLCIGDAAHAMSPVGGVGINLAVQDAVATANLLAAPLLTGKVPQSVLERVQRRREFPTRVTQWIQIQAQNRIISKVLASEKSLSVPWILKLMQRWPLLQRIPARAIGLGVRPEHIHTPEIHRRQQGAGMKMIS